MSSVQCRTFELVFTVLWIVLRTPESWTAPPADLIQHARTDVTAGMFPIGTTAATRRLIASSARPAPPQPKCEACGA